MAEVIIGVHGRTTSLLVRRAGSGVRGNGLGGGGNLVRLKIHGSESVHSVGGAVSKGQVGWVGRLEGRLR